MLACTCGGGRALQVGSCGGGLLPLRCVSLSLLCSALRRRPSLYIHKIPSTRLRGSQTTKASFASFSLSRSRPTLYTRIEDDEEGESGRCTSGGTSRRRPGARERTISAFLVFLPMPDIRERERKRGMYAS